MISTGTKPFLKAFGDSVEKVQVQDGAEETVRILGIISAPGRELEFSGVRIVSDDFTMVYAIAEMSLAANEKISVTTGQFVGAYMVQEPPAKSADGVFGKVKLGKVE